MSANQSKHKLRNYIIRSLVFTLVPGAMVVYLFGPGGAVFTYLGADFTFLLLPLVGYFLLKLSSHLSDVLIRPRRGPIVAIVLNGAALSFLSYFFFDQAVLLSAPGGAQDFLFDVRRLAPLSLLYFAGYTATRLTGLLRPDSWEGRASPGVAATGQILMGLALWMGFANFAPYWSALDRIGLIFLAVMLVMAVSKLGAYGERASNKVVVDISRWLKASTKAKFFLGASIAAYLVFIRPAIFSHLSYAFLVEWIVICLAAWFILAGIRGGLKKWYSRPLKEAAWQKHVQRVSNIADEEFEKLVVFQRDFVDKGSRQDLLACLKQTLLDNQLDDAKINQSLERIINYQDMKIPWYTLWIWRLRIQRRIRDERFAALENTMQNLGKIANPGH